MILTMMIIKLIIRLPMHGYCSLLELTLYAQCDKKNQPAAMYIATTVDVLTLTGGRVANVTIHR